jgi:polysaccharide biosynthesis protein PslG
MRRWLPPFVLLAASACQAEEVEARGARACSSDDDCAASERCAVGLVQEIELEPGDEPRCIDARKLIGAAPASWQFRPGGRSLGERLCLAGGLNRGAGAESDAIRARQIELLLAAGAAAVRIDFHWSVIEPERGAFDFSALDPPVDAAVAAGIELIGIIAYGVPWASSLTDSDPMYPPDDPADYASYARALAQHYAGRVRRWELWNEPNGGWRFFRPSIHGDAAHYARMMNLAAGAIRESCADCTVYSAGLFFHNQVVNGAIEFTHDMLTAEPDAFDRIDGFGIHPYTRYPPSVAPELDERPERALSGMLDDLERVFAAHGRQAPPWAATELGWPAWGKVDEAAQASLLSRGILLGAALGQDPLCWFTLADGPEHGQFPPEDDFGLYRFGSESPAGESSPKPARDAFALLAELGAAAAPAGASPLAGFHDPAAGRFALDFELPAGRWTALWQLSGSPLLLELPGETRRALDQFGAELAPGGSNGLELVLTDAPVHLMP